MQEASTQDVYVLGTDNVATAVAAQLGVGARASTMHELPPAARVVIVSAEAHFDRLAPTLRYLLHRQAHVVAACEEMAWPWYGHPHLADVMSTEARRAGRAVLGVGAFSFETLPLLAANVVEQLRALRVDTHIGPDTTRVAAWQRLGLGLPLARWKVLKTARTVQAIGVAESVTLLAQGLGRHPMQSEILVDLLPRTDGAGNVAAVRAVGRYKSEAGEGLEIEFAIEAAADDPHGSQRVTFEGEKTVELAIDHTAGPAAMAARLLHAAEKILSLPPGLHTVLNLPLANASPK
jgi:hypothetical protein